MTARRGEQREPAQDESWPEIHEELGRLPARFREPVVLCHLEGLTQEQAARRLGCPIGTVQSRLARGRDRLRARLLRRGLAPAAAALASASMGPAEAAVSAAWVETTARAALQIAAGRSIAGSVPAAVLLIWQSGSRSLMMSRLLLGTCVLAAVGVIAVGSAALGRAGRDGGNPRAGATGHPTSPQAGGQPRPVTPLLVEVKAPSIVGRWRVLYMSGPVHGKREAYVDPNLIVPVTEETINLPIFGGNQGPSITSGAASADGRTGAGTFAAYIGPPILYKGNMRYTAERKDQLNLIHVPAQPVGEKQTVGVEAIYRVMADNLVICYDPERATRPSTFAAEKDTEIVLVLRNETPGPIYIVNPVRVPLDGGGAATSPPSTERIDGVLAPPKVEKRSKP